MREISRQIFDWCASGAGDHDAPSLTCFDHASSFQCRNQPGSNQRGLATARYTDDGEKAVALEPRDQLRDLLIASKEQVRLGGLERPQSRIGIGLRAQTLDDPG